MRSKHGGDGGTGVYMREGTTSRVTAADRPYGEFYGFYSVSPENFGSTHVCLKETPQKILEQMRVRHSIEKYCFVFFPVCQAFHQSSEAFENI